MQGLISAEQLAQALAEQNGVAWESIDARQIPSSLIAEMPASVALHYAVLPLRLENDELIVGSEDGIDPVSLAALTRKVGRKVRYVIVLRGQIVTGLRHWYARRRGHDPRAMLYNAVQHQWLTEQQTGEIWRQYVPHQFLFAEILTTLGHINRSAINVLLLRHERSSLPLGKFWSPKALSARNVGSRPDNSTRITSFDAITITQSRFKHRTGCATGVRK